jgi:hypothetical protein
LPMLSGLLGVDVISWNSTVTDIPDDTSHTDPTTLHVPILVACVSLLCAACVVFMYHLFSVALLIH